MSEIDECKDGLADLPPRFRMADTNLGSIAPYTSSQGAEMRSRSHPAGVLSYRPLGLRARGEPVIGGWLPI